MVKSSKGLVTANASSAQPHENLTFVPKMPITTSISHFIFSKIFPLLSLDHLLIRYTSSPNSIQNQKSYSKSVSTNAKHNPSSLRLP